MAALLVRLLYLTEQAGASPLFVVQLLDEQEVADGARALLRGEGFGPQPLFKAPLYTLIVAGAMATAGEAWLWALRLVQHVAGALLVPMAYDTARRVAGTGHRGRIAGIAAAALVAFYAPLVRLENRLILDFLVVFWQSAMLWALVRFRTTPHHASRWALAAGAFAALAVLTRPTVLPVLPFLAAWMVGSAIRRLPRVPLSSRRRLAGAAAFLLLPFVALTAVYWRNATAGGEGMVLPWQGGYSFYYANTAGANGRYFVQSDWTNAAGGNPAQDLAVHGFEQAIARGEAPSPISGQYYHALNAYWQDRAKAEIAAHPAAWLGLMARKGVYLLSAREIFNFEDYTVHRDLSGILPRLPFHFGLVWPLALASLAFLPAMGRARRGMYGLMSLYGVLLGGAIALYYTSGRLRMPLFFPAVVMGAAGIGHAAAQLRAMQFARLRRLAPAGALLVAGVVISWGDWWGVRSENLRHAEFARLSNAAFQIGWFGDALEHADRVEAEKPGLPTTPQLRAQALYGMHRYRDAARAFRTSLARLPHDPVAAYNLGSIYTFDLDDAASGLEYYQEALRRDPSYRAAAWEGAMAALREGDDATADELLAPDMPAGAGDPLMLMCAEAALAYAHRDDERGDELVALLARQGGKFALDRLGRQLNAMPGQDYDGLIDDALSRM